jgi:hypothetical protein
MEKEKATEVTGCKTCKEGLSGTQKGIMVFAIYLLIAGIVGTIDIVKYLVNLLD